MTTHICLVCGKPRPPRRKTCSPECARNLKRSHTRERVCLVCAKPFRTVNARICSAECRKVRWRQYVGRLPKDESGPHLLERRCVECGKTFQGHANAKVCSKACGQRRAKALQRVSKGIERPVCKVCGKAYEGEDWEAHKNTCSEECRLEAKKAREKRAYTAAKSKRSRPPA